MQTKRRPTEEPPPDDPPPEEPAPAEPQADGIPNFQEEYGRIVNGGESVNAIDMGQFGESVDLSTGKTEFTATDVSLPGNNAIPVAFGRSRSIDNHGGVHARMLGDWDMDIPYMEGVFVKGQTGQPANPQGWIVGVANPAQRPYRCSAPASFAQVAPLNYGASSIPPKEYWQGIHLHAPGQGRQEVLYSPSSGNPRPTDGRNYRYVTSGQWYLACDGATGLPSGQTGDGYIARAPDGLVYRFNWMVAEDYAPFSRPRGGAGSNSYDRQRIRLYPTQVEDRDGNTVTYTWSGNRLMQIGASDGRTLTLAWNGINGASCSTAAGALCSVSDGTRTWTYGYTIISTGPNYRLTRVTLPDTSQWTLDFGDIGWGQMLYQSLPSPPTLGYDRALSCNWMRLLANNQRTVTMTHPSGASATFTFDVKRHGRTKVGYDCTETVGSDDQLTHFPDIPARFDTWSITGKTVSGPGITPYTWTYSYSLPVGSFAGQACPSGGCPTTKAITVTAPDGSYSTHTYGIEWEKNDGHLLQVESYSAGNALLSSRSQAYPATSLLTLGQTPQWYMADSWQAEQVRPVKTSTLVQNGVTFTRNITAFDAYARPATVVKSASPGSSKTEVTTYEDNTAKWVVGQMKTVTVGGVQTDRVDYNTDARPSAVWRFNKKQYDLIYHASGTSKGNVWQVTDEKNQTTTYTDYYRGIARRVDFADARFQTATVNTLGLVTGITNEAGFTTSYGYYTHGRLQSITYPAADSVTWTPRTFVFEKVGSAEYGIPAGHWRQTISQGNARTVTYYDALWRPVLTRSYDTANETGTRRMVLSRFDHAGKTTFASYPQRTIASITASPDGVTSSYDALGRLTQTVAASELGNLTTGIAYLSGYQKQVTNPRGFVTTTSFQLFDEPSEDAPTTISEPLGTTTTISRNVWGLPTAMTRSGTYLGSAVSVTRSYVYDSNRRLCKTIEPESGATVVNYDLAGNLSWRAAGQALTSTSSCEQASVAANQRTNYTYDARNRLTLTTFGDGSPSIDTSYTADGLPWTVSSDGSLWSYTYNKRRLLESEVLAMGVNSYAIGHTYNANGHESVLTYPDGTSVAYGPNALGEQTRVGNYVTGVTRHPNGAVANFTYGNGIAHTGTQTIRGLPDLSSDARVGLNVLNDDYDWDANGNVTAITSGIGEGASRSLQYDARDRLTRASYDKLGPAQVDFSYDPLDNLRRYVTPGRNYTHEYHATTNRLTRIYEQIGGTQVNKYQYSYTADAGNRGNVTSRAKVDDATSQVFTFDQGNRMRALAGTAAATYQYDGLGRRTQVIDTAFIRIQVYSQAGKLLYDWAENLSGIGKYKAATTRYLYLDNHLVAKGYRRHPNNEVPLYTYLHTDGLGSPVAETDAAGNLVSGSRSLHEPYGLLVYGPGAQGPGYAGHVRDAATGLSYMQQRYYDPIAGRFLSVDPVQASAGSFNRYWYANNNPYKNVDPDGRLPFIAVAIYAAGALAFSDYANAPAPGQEGISASPSEVLSAGLPPAKVAGLVKMGVTATRAGRNGVEGPAKVDTRTTRAGEPAAKVTYPDGSVKDVSTSRVKEYVPETNPKAPAGTMQKVEFDDAQAGSKGYKRDPTIEDLDDAGLKK